MKKGEGGEDVLNYGGRRRKRGLWVKINVKKIMESFLIYLKIKLLILTYIMMDYKIESELSPTSNPKILFRKNYKKQTSVNNEFNIYKVG